MPNDVISYEELRRVQSLERDEKSLQEIEESFFKKVIKYVKTKEKMIEENKNKNNVFSEQALEKNKHELNNINKIIKDICERRRRKIVNQALNNISARVHNIENMLPEEEELYNKTIDIVKEYTNNFMLNFDSDSLKEEKRENVENREYEEKKEVADEKIEKEEELDEKIEQEEELDKSDKGYQLKVREEIPEFVWKDGKKYGPFKEGEIINIERTIGEILIKGGKAIEISDE